MKHNFALPGRFGSATKGGGGSGCLATARGSQVASHTRRAGRSLQLRAVNFSGFQNWSVYVSAET